MDLWLQVVVLPSMQFPAVFCQIRLLRTRQKPYVIAKNL